MVNNGGEFSVYAPRNVSLSAKETKLREIAATFEYKEMEYAFKNVGP
jgi:hypothetical protein